MNPMLLSATSRPSQVFRSSLIASLTVLCLLSVCHVPEASAMLKHVERVSPRVGQCGTTVVVTIEGMCLKEAREIVFYRPGIRAVEIEVMPNLQYPVGLAHGGRIEEQIRCKFEIAADCLPGEHPFRVRTATEITSIGTFHVTPFNVIDENETTNNGNDTLETALAVVPNVTVRARMGNSGRGDVDLYRVPVVAGQRLTVEVDSVRIADIHYGGSEFDLAARILDESGHELAANDDNPVHLQDPVLSVKVPQDGIAYVEVRRSVFVPDDRIYSVHIGAHRLPLATYPLGGQAGTSQVVQLLGDPLGDVEETIAIPSQVGMFEYRLDGPSPLLLRSSAYPNVMEDPAAAETRVGQLPIALNGRIDVREDRDAFRVSVKKGERYRVRVFAATLASPIDPTLRIRSADSPELVEVEMDDALLPDRDVFGTSFRSGGGLKDTLDPSVVWEPKNDGDYLIELADTSGSFGTTAVYRVEIESAADEVQTLLGSTAFDWVECIRTSGLVVPQGNRWTVNIQLPQSQGSSYQGELELIAEGLPPGVKVLGTRVPAGSRVWPLQFVADATAPPCATTIRLLAQPVDPNKKWLGKSQQNIPFINHSGGDAWRTVRLDRYVLAVTDPAPFTIEVTSPPAALVRGGELAIPVKIIRRAGFNEPVQFQCDWIPPGVSMQPATTIAPGESEAVLRITAEPNAPLGVCPLVVVASTTRDNLDPYLGTGRVRVSSEITQLTIAEPFVEFTVAQESVRRGERKAYVWAVQHKSPFEGNAAVTLLGLPKGVNVVEPLPLLTKDSQTIEFQIEATSEALLGSVRGVSCEVVVQAGGQEIRQRTGSGTLRIDPLLE